VKNELPSRIGSFYFFKNHAIFKMNQRKTNYLVPHGDKFYETITLLDVFNPQNYNQNSVNQKIKNS
jgi:hypothetical protein